MLAALLLVGGGAILSHAHEHNTPAVLLLVGSRAILSSAHEHNDVRCKCICPNPGIVNATSTHSQRKIYIDNVPPSECDCRHVVVPRLELTSDAKQEHYAELPDSFCPRCTCRYEQRNTGVIKVVVVVVIWVIVLLVIYMLFLVVLDPLILRRKHTQYQEHREEEMALAQYPCMLQAREEATSQSGDEVNMVTARSSRPTTRGGAVLQRVTGQQNRWQKQVQEQRKHIYDRHTMLN